MQVSLMAVDFPCYYSLILFIIRFASTSTNCWVGLFHYDLRQHFVETQGFPKNLLTNNFFASSLSLTRAMTLSVGPKLFVEIDWWKLSEAQLTNLFMLEVLQLVPS